MNNWISGPPEKEGHYWVEMKSSPGKVQLILLKKDPDWGWYIDYIGTAYYQTDTSLISRHIFIENPTL